jgi:hypothetical protein
MNKEHETPWKDLLIMIDYFNIQDGESKFVNGHHIAKYSSRINVFGNNRDFPAPIGYKLIDAYIGLVDTDPVKSRMALPNGQIDVILPNGKELKIGDIVPNDITTVKVETPNTTGVSNWAGPYLVFEKVNE